MSEAHERFEFNLDEQWEVDFLSHRLGVAPETLRSAGCGNHPTVGELVERLAVRPFHQSITGV